MGRVPVAGGGAERPVAGVPGAAGGGAAQRSPESRNRVRRAHDLVGAGAGQLGVAVWTAAVAVVLLDLVDGALARQFGGSPGGAVLDMEADQLTTLGLAALVVSIGGKAHVLLLPAMRPAFVLAAWWLRIPAHDPKPVNGDNRRGRRVCAAVMTALLIALCPATGPVLRDVVTGIAVLLLAWSFLGDARFLLAHRARARA